MKKILLPLLLLSVIFSATAADLVILQTNDTHSQLDPAADGLGGLARRKVLIDSIRSANPYVILVDDGDAVQGTLYYNLFAGQAEAQALRLLGYDIAILGNHDFDNGTQSLASLLRQNHHPDSPLQYLATNYRFHPSLGLDSIFRPYLIRQFDGKKIAFIGLNFTPKGMIAEGCYDGLEYLDLITAANATAWHLKHNEGVDAVIAITHLGYDGGSPVTDRDLIAASSDIDIVLGGHSHTRVIPGSGKEWLPNAQGNPVLVTQAGARGNWLSQITIPLDSIGLTPPRYKQYPVTSRLDSRADPAVDRFLAPLRTEIARQMSQPVARTSQAYDNHSPQALNFISDFVASAGSSLLGRPVDLAITNKGSLRSPLPKGTVTRGDIYTLQPFNNRIVVLQLRGSDLEDALDIMARRGGDGLSASASATIDRHDPDHIEADDITINGQPLDPERLYTVATLDYLANGGDYMHPLTRGKRLASSTAFIRDLLIDHLRLHPQINPSPTPRMR